MIYFWTKTVSVVLLLYTNTMDFKPRNQDVIGVQIFSFNSRGFTQVSQ